MEKNEILEKYFDGLTVYDLIQPEQQPDLEQKRVIKTINCIETTMKVYAGEITYTQMRNIYSKILNARDVTSMHKVRPVIAYIHARLDKEKAKHITTFILEIMKVITEPKQVETFKELMETMVAFHKQYSRN